MKALEMFEVCRYNDGENVLPSQIRYNMQEDAVIFCNLKPSRKCLKRKEGCFNNTDSPSQYNSFAIGLWEVLEVAALLSVKLITSLHTPICL